MFVDLDVVVRAFVIVIAVITVIIIVIITSSRRSVPIGPSLLSSSAGLFDNKLYLTEPERPPTSETLYLLKNVISDTTEIINQRI